MMRATPVAGVAPKRSGGALPILGICCLFAVGAAIAITIVLALIPLYLSNKSVDSSNAANNATFYVKYQSTGNPDSALTGTVANRIEIQNQLNQALGLGENGLRVVSALSQTAFARRRRSVILHRSKRDTVNNIMLQCVPLFAATCQLPSCQMRARKRLLSKLQSIQEINNVSVQVTSREFGNSAANLNLQFVAIDSSPFDGFGGEPSVLGQFVAIESGEFNQPSVWAEGIVPYGKSVITISPGVRVTLSKSYIDLNIAKINVNGTLVLGTQNSTAVTFRSPVNIAVYPGGSLIDNTGGNRIISPAGTILNVYPNGTLVGNNTDLSVPSASRSLRSSRATRIGGFNGNGPRTCGILPGNSIEVHTRITLMVAVSGQLNAGSTMLGGEAPTASMCALAGGCGMSLSLSVTISTSALGGTLGMQFSLFTVSVVSTFQVGTQGSTAGFRFTSAMTFNNYGLMQDVSGTTGGIYVTVGTSLNFFAGARFSAVIDTFLYVYDPLTGATIGVGLRLAASFTGPFFISVSLTGSISTSTIGPGLDDGASPNSTPATASSPGASPGAPSSGQTSSSSSGASVTVSSVTPSPPTTVPVQTPAAPTTVPVQTPAAPTTVPVQTPAAPTTVPVQTPAAPTTVPVQTPAAPTTVPVQTPAAPTTVPVQTPAAPTTVPVQTPAAPTTVPVQTPAAPTTVPVQTPAAPTTVPVQTPSPPTTVSGETPSPPTTRQGTPVQTTPSSTSGGSVTTTVEPSDVCRAIQSGSFEDPNTWNNGIVPNGQCSVVISSGLTVTCTGAVLNINIPLLTIEGTFVVTSSGGVGFAFGFSINILIRAGGTFQDQTDNNKLCFQTDTVVTFLPGAFFVGISTQVFTCSGSPPTVGVGASVEFGSNIIGPFTFGILVDGTTRTFQSVMCIVRRSGEFTTGLTWLGGIAPTVDFCAGVGGCDLFIFTGFILSTGSLSGNFNIRFNFVIIIEGATFELGTASLTTGFWFRFSITIQCYGTLTSYVDGIYMVGNSTLNFYDGGRFTSTLFVYLYVYNVITLEIIGQYELGFLIIGPYFIVITIDGRFLVTFPTTTAPPATTTPVIGTTPSGQPTGTTSETTRETSSNQPTTTPGLIETTTSSEPQTTSSSSGPTETTEPVTTTTSEQPDETTCGGGGGGKTCGPIGTTSVGPTETVASSEPQTTSSFSGPTETSGATATGSIGSTSITTPGSIATTSVPVGTTASGGPATTGSSLGPTETSEGATTGSLAPTGTTSQASPTTTSRQAPTSGSDEPETTAGPTGPTTDSGSVTTESEGPTIITTNEIITVTSEQTETTGSGAPATTASPPAPTTSGETFPTTTEQAGTTASGAPATTATSPKPTTSGETSATTSRLAETTESGAPATTTSAQGSTISGGTSVTTSGLAETTVSGETSATTSGQAGTSVSGGTPATTSGLAETTVSGETSATTSGPAGTTASGGTPATTSGLAATTVSSETSATTSGPVGTTASGGTPATTSGLAETTVSGETSATTSGQAGTTASGGTPATTSGLAETTVSGETSATTSGQAGTTVSGGTSATTSGLAETTVSVETSATTSGQAGTTGSGGTSPTTSGLAETTVSGETSATTSRQAGTTVSGETSATTSGLAETTVSGETSATTSRQAGTTVSGETSATTSGLAETTVSSETSATTSRPAGTTASGGTLATTSGLAETTVSGETSATTSGQAGTTVSGETSATTSGLAETTVSSETSATTSGQAGTTVSGETLATTSGLAETTVSGETQGTTSGPAGTTASSAPQTATSSSGLTETSEGGTTGSEVPTGRTTQGGVSTEVTETGMTEVPTTTQSVLSTLVTTGGGVITEETSPLATQGTETLVTLATSDATGKSTGATLVSQTSTVVVTEIGTTTNSASLQTTRAGTVTVSQPFSTDGGVETTGTVNVNTGSSEPIVTTAGGSTGAPTTVGGSTAGGSTATLIIQTGSSEPVFTTAGATTAGATTAAGSTAGATTAGGSTATLIVQTGSSEPIFTTAGATTAGATTAAGSTTGATTPGGSTATLIVQTGSSEPIFTTAGATTAGATTAAGSTTGATTPGGSTATLIVQTGSSEPVFTTAGATTAGPTTAAGSTTGATTPGGSTATLIVQTGSSEPVFTTAGGSTAGATTAAPATAGATTARATTAAPATAGATTAGATTAAPATVGATTAAPTTAAPTTAAPTTAAPTTAAPTTAGATTPAPTTAAPTTTAPAVCRAIRSGEFNDSSIWENGFAPGIGCDVLIPANIIVTCTGGRLEINVQVIIIEGTFTLISTGGIGFSFAFSISIMVRSGGTFTDQTSNFQLCFQRDSVVTILPGGGFVGSNTQVYVCASSTPYVGIGSFATFGSSIIGPYTYGLLLGSDDARTFGSVMCLARQSGSFTVGTSWLGGVAPTGDFCSSVGGCDAYIPPGVNLDTTSLNGGLNIRFNVITVISGGTLQLVTVGANGFSFSFSFTFIVYGTVGVSGAGSLGIRIPFGSDFNLFGGATIAATSNVPLNFFDPSTGVTANDTITLATGPSAGVYVEVSTTGTVQQTSALTFTVARSGLFSDSATWLGGAIPTGNCSIRIPVGITLTLVGPTFSVNILVLTVRGTLILSSSAGFTFSSTINIMIARGGIVRDQTTTSSIYLQVESVFTWFPRSFFFGSNTVVYSYSGSSSSVTIDSVSIRSRFVGPFTVGLLFSGQIQTYGSVMCIARQSGSFTSGSSWIGGIAPTRDFCSSVSGCELSVPSGVTLDTTPLNGVLDIRFNLVFVANGGTFQLVAGPGGFSFSFSFTFIVYGSVGYASSTDVGIYIPFGSDFNLFGSARIVSGFSVTLFLFNPSTNAVSGSSYSLQANATQTLFLTTTSTGSVQQNAGGTFIAGYSGSFLNATTWIGGELPTGTCYIRIPANIAVTFSGDTLSIPVLQMNILGTFTVVATGSAGFTFNSSINIFVGEEGSFVDETATNTLNFRSDSILTFATGAFFVGTNTRLFVVNSAVNFTLGSNVSTALTVAFPIDGSISTYSSVMCLLRQSGDFTSGSTWLGQVAPDLTFCTTVGGCDITVPAGFILSTESLNGSVSIPFNVITVSVGGTFQFGTPSITSGFRFALPITLAIYGRLQNVVSGGQGLYIPLGSQFDFYGSASFVTPSLTALRAYNATSNLNIGSGIILDNQTVSFFLQISLSGVISIDGGGTAATTIPTTPVVTQLITFSALTSGDFNDPEIWATGSVPTDNALIVIPPGVSIDYSGSGFGLYFRTFLVYGTLSIVSTDSSGFTFAYPVNILVGSVGTFSFQSSASSRINLVSGSVLSFASGSTYAGVSADLFAYSGNLSQAVSASNISLTTSLQGPLTYEITSSLTTRSFPRITFIVRKSGSFLDNTVWPGLYRPSATFCPSSQGCGLYIGAGLNFSTTDLNGTMTISFSRITVESSAVLQLGTPTLTNGFRLRSALRLDSYGTLQYIGQSNTNLLVPSSSSVNIYTGGSFSSAVQVSLASYNGVNASAILNTVALTSLNGPRFFNISSTGDITNTTTVPIVPAR